MLAMVPEDHDAAGPEDSDQTTVVSALPDFSHLEDVLTDTEDEESTEDVDPRYYSYVKGQLLKKLFDPIKVAKYFKWQYADFLTAPKVLQHYVDAVVNRASEFSHSQRKILQSNVKALKSFNWSAKQGSWIRHWERLKMEEDMRFNKLRQDQEGVAHLTSLTKRARKLCNPLRDLEDSDEESLNHKKKRAKANTGTVSKGSFETANMSGLDIILKKKVWEQLARHRQQYAIPDVFKDIARHWPSDSSVHTRVIDLRVRSSEWKNRLTQATVESFASYCDNILGDQSTIGLHEYLDGLFQPLQSVSVEKWETSLANTAPPTCDTLKEAFATIKQTFGALRHISVRAFLAPFNPLTQSDTLECTLLNEFFHPIMREALYRFGAMTTWKYGEIGHDYFIQRECADGVGILRGTDQLPILYFEGSRLKPKKTKGAADAAKTLRNGASMFAHTLERFVRANRRLPTLYQGYIGQLIGRQISFALLQYHGDIFCFDYDFATIPCIPEDVHLFAKFYSIIIGVAIMVGKTVREMENTQISKWMSRRSLLLSAMGLDEEDL
ncbi:hypothetical protein BC832DRAFT_596374 [Gaertneriomyces semiglobifer]|nr:hypothetical protein BC832DRAFT_596374 [Gaertneriomyces semiglobifer]